MLRATLELVPYGLEKDRKNLGKIIISNNLTGTEEEGNYNVRLFDGEGVLIDKGEVKAFPRMKADAWQLLSLALGNLFVKRHGFEMGGRVKIKGVK